ncbi:MAG: NmrA family NAD(P)-binding protein [Pseudomonadales bacterium]|nr:NmrA family NAD(P)-binding protein [Pseudomonadales bacterium]NRA16599.1 NmrA family NAD(P)-binding protein [Oceanospirillaceae bacterium]
MKIRIFGAAGNIGSRIVSEALARGHKINAVVRKVYRNNPLSSANKTRIGEVAVTRAPCEQSFANICNIMG